MFAKGRITPDPSKDTRSARPAKPSTKDTDRYALLQRKVENLEKIHQEGKKAHHAEAEKLKQELSRALKANNEQTERYEKLKKQSDILESRVQELKKLHDNGQSELKELRTKLRLSEHERTQLASKQGDVGEAKKALQVLESKRRDELRERDRKVADLEKVVTTEKKKRELLEARYSEVKGKVDGETLRAQSRASELERELEEAKSVASRATTSYNALQLRADNTERDLLAQLEQHRQMLSRVAEEYGRLASSSVPKAEHDRVKHELASTHIRSFRLDRKLAVTESQVQDLAQLIRQNREDNHLLLSHLRESAFTAAVYSSALKDALADRSPPSLDRGLYEDFVTLRHERAEFDMESQRVLAIDSSLWFNLYRHQHDLLLLHSSSLLKDIEERDQQIQQRSDQVSAIEEQYAALQNSLVPLHSERDSLQSRLAESMANLAEVNGRVEVLKKERQDVEARLKAELITAEQSLAQEKQANQRLASTVQKSRQAEEALQADIDQLTESLAEAEQYREAYADLLEEAESLVQRNALAEDEAQRLSRFNAEIVGHKNPAQRIMYLDRIRRELHDTKQQLLALQRDRDAVIYENDDLKHELGLYKSVAVPADYKPRTHITRVGRAPLGDQNVNARSTNGAVPPISEGDEIFMHLPEYKEDDLTLEEIM
ncbi:hypothetical protein BXZ70DRAFT_27229 [Cristinia sonorae]|uniref:Uncharacterized protein n=1 Tax=Cristinia sonorae TaxID=1940300 RepID=A0A8K0V0K7_9AGAR|nr:hypothetical protein BXZ70DRAFT_27229 [Cristinia sonorae]